MLSFNDSIEQTIVGENVQSRIDQEQKRDTYRVDRIAKVSCEIVELATLFFLNQNANVDAGLNRKCPRTKEPSERFESCTKF